MTRDEILAMEAGRELDALVAEKVMGKRIKWREDDDALLEFNAILQHTDGTPFESWIGIQGYSTDIAAAWNIQMKMRFCLIPRIDGGWNALPWEDISRTGPLPTSAGSARTAPLAICRAALLAVMDAG